jgi:hypothetical protein
MIDYLIITGIGTLIYWLAEFANKLTWYGYDDE